MNSESKTPREKALAELRTVAQQHQTMRMAFPAYGEFLDWLKSQRADCDAAWVGTTSQTALDMLRGRAGAFSEIIGKLESYLNHNCDTVPPDATDTPEQGPIAT